MESNTDNLKVAINALESKREELYKLVEEYHLQLKAITETINSLKSAFGGFNDSHKIETKLYSFASNTNEYHERLPSTRKVLFILNEQKKFLRFRDIAEIILKKENRQIHHVPVTHLASHLTTSTQGLKKSKKIIKYKEIYWGLPEWFDEEKNEVKPEYRPEETKGILSQIFREMKKP